MPLRKVSHLEKAVAAASGVVRNVCSEGQPYHTAQELWEGIKQGEEGTRLLFILFVHLRKKERMHSSVEKGNRVRGQETGYCSEEGALAPLFVDAPRSSVSAKNQSMWLR